MNLHSTGWREEGELGRRPEEEGGGRGRKKNTYNHFWHHGDSCLPRAHKYVDTKESCLLRRAYGPLQAGTLSLITVADPRRDIVSRQRAAKDKKKKKKQKKRVVVLIALSLSLFAPKDLAGSEPVFCFDQTHWAIQVGRRRWCDIQSIDNHIQV